MSEQTIETEVGRLVAALLEAQQAIQGIAKDGENTFHRYRYVSAESMFRETRKVLADAGVSVLPLSTSIRVEERSIRIPIGNRVVEGVEGHGILCRRYLVAHRSGQSLEFSQEWPIVPENGRPLDKATGAADTASFSYFLRDLLLIPRVEQGTDLDGDDRDETDVAPPMATQRQGQRIGEQLDRLGIGATLTGEDFDRARARAVGRAAGLREPVFPGALRMADAVRCLEVLEAAETPAPPARSAHDSNGPRELTPGPITDDAADAAEESFGVEPPSAEPDPPSGARITPMQSLGIRTLFGELDVADTDHRRRLVEHIVDRPVESTRDLTADEAQRVLERLTNESARREVGTADQTEPTAVGAS